MWTIAGSLTVLPATTRTDLLAEPVTAALAALDPAQAARCGVAEIDPELADTAAFCRDLRLPARRVRELRRGRRQTRR